MSGARITIDLDDANLRAALGRLVTNIQHPDRALRSIGDYMLRSTDQRFRAQVGPDGKAWAPLSEVTLLRRLQARKGALREKRTATGGQTLTAKGHRILGGAKILRDSGALQDTIRYQLVAGGLEVGTNRIYGAVQQFGAKMGQFGRYSQLWRRSAYQEGDFRRAAGTKKGFPIPWGDIPARPYLGVSAADRDQILAILRRHLGGQA